MDDPFDNAPARAHMNGTFHTIVLSNYTDDEISDLRAQAYALEQEISIEMVMRAHRRPFDWEIDGEDIEWIE